MKKNVWKWASAVLATVGIISVGLLVQGRMSVENQAKQVEFTLDYSELQKMASQSEHNTQWWMEEFKKLGIHSVAIPEESFKSLSEEGRGLDYGMVGTVRKDLDWQAKYPAPLVAGVQSKEYLDHMLIVRVQEPAVQKIVREGLSERYPQSFYDTWTENGIDYYLLKTRVEDVLVSGKEKLYRDNFTKADQEMQTPVMSMGAMVGLGFDPVKIQMAKSAGLDIVPRTTNYGPYSKELVSAYEKELNQYGIKPRMALFLGKEVTGYPEGQSDLAAFLKKNHIAVALVESAVQRSQIEQKDTVKLTKDMNYQAVRVFSIPDFIQKRFAFYNYSGPEEIDNTIYRAVTERNIRDIYFKPYKYDDVRYVTDPKSYETSFAELKLRLAPHGITMGNISLMDYHKPSPLNQMLVAIGLWGIFMLFMDRVVSISNRMGWIGLGFGILGCVGMYKVMPGLAPEVTGLVAAILYSLMGGWYFIRKTKALFLSDNTATMGATLFEGAKTLLLTTAFSLMGGLTIGGVLSGSEYLLEMEIFRGVKAMQIVPLGFIVLLYIYEFGYKRNRKELGLHKHFAGDFAKILFEDIKILYVILGLVVGAIGYIYIARTGHETNIQPSDFEMIARNFLEYVLLARPRTKEFLLAFPAIIMTFAFARFHLKKLLFPGLLAGMIGLTSVPNTFSHLRTPIYLSVDRTLYSVGFGLVIGIVFTILFWGIARMIEKKSGSTTA